MKILAHRGYWNQEIADNSPAALKGALLHGYGLESDVRDYDGKLVIAHYVAGSGSPCTQEVFQWLSEYHDRFCFAINIKADGLGKMLQEQLERYQIQNYFTFDMSVPQMIEYQQLGLTYFTRQSEVEPQPVLYENASGVWIDAFYEEGWITQQLLQKHIDAQKLVCLVSPDLHQREYRRFWSRLKEYSVDFSKVMLCTDHPDEARQFFANLVV